MPVNYQEPSIVLSVRDVSIAHGDKTIVHPISFRVKAGEVLAIIGANGAGKSTLLNHIIEGAGAREYQYQGDMLLSGQITDAIPAQAKAQQIALLPQASRLQFPFTVEEVVALGRTPHSTGKQYDQTVVQSLLARLDITHLRRHIYTHLSGGEKQRVHIARVLAQLTLKPDGDHGFPPRLLLLDEPCNALDMQHQQQLLAIIQQLQTENIAVVLVCHDLNWAAQCADCFLALKQGELIAQGSAQTVITPESLHAIYGIQANIMTHPVTKRPVVLM